MVSQVSLPCTTALLLDNGSTLGCALRAFRFGEAKATAGLLPPKWIYPSCALSPASPRLSSHACTHAPPQSAHTWLHSLYWFWVRPRAAAAHTRSQAQTDRRCLRARSKPLRGSVTATLPTAKSLWHMRGFPHESERASHTAAWKDIKSPTGNGVALN